jgi:hypothetical protein
VAAQMLPNQGLIMAKLNRAAARLSGAGPSPRAAGAREPSPLAPLGRLAYRLVVTSLGAAIIVFLMFWWPHIHDTMLEIPPFAHWTVSQLLITAADGFLAGIVLAAAGWVRPFSAEMSGNPLGGARKRVPLNLVLCLFGAVSLPLALVVYLLIAYLQGYLSLSILGVFGVAIALTCGFVAAAPPIAQLETLWLGGNLLFLTLLLGWYVGDLFRPRWAY